MIRTKFLISGFLGMVLLLGSSARAQENGFMRNEVAVQGTGLFTKDSQQNGTQEHSSNTGGFLVNYRFHINGWLAAEASYGYDRNTQQDFTPGGNFGIQANVHQATGALVVNLPVSVHRMRPYVLAGAGALVFDPTGNAGGFVSGASRPTSQPNADIRFNHSSASRAFPMPSRPVINRNLTFGPSVSLAKRRNCEISSLRSRNFAPPARGRKFATPSRSSFGSRMSGKLGHR